MPRIFGLIPSDEPMPFSQQFSNIGGGTVGNNATGTFNVGTFTMPFAGELFADLTVVYSWSGFQHVMVGIQLSTPAPTGWSQFQHLALQSSTLRSQLPMYATWSNLAKGQIVTLVLWGWVGGGGPSVAFEAISGTVRATRLGA